MAIQFCCSQCGQPIEVDDAHAGRTATCPYCHHAVAVPAESTYQPAQAAAARPLGDQPAVAPSAPPSQTVAWGPPKHAVLPDRVHAAARWGQWSLKCSVTGVVLLVGAMIVSVFTLAPQYLAQAQKGPPTLEQMEQMQQIPGVTWLSLTSNFGLLLGAVGTVLGIVSLVQSRSGNWRGWAGLAIGGAMLVCVCGVVFLFAVMMAAGVKPAG